MEVQFDIARIIVARIVDSRLSSHRWLPKKQKTCFFGLIKRNAWHSEGFYSNGCYQECYESGCWDAYPSTRDQLEKDGYLVDDLNQVWVKPYVTLYLENDRSVSRYFEDYSSAVAWVDALKAASGKTFETIKNSK